MTTAPPKPMTLHEFVDFLDTVDEKYELIDGRPVMMAGAAEPHIVIASRVNSECVNALDVAESRCRFFGIGVYVHTPIGRTYMPDGAIAPTARFIAKGTIDNPCTVFEILSPSTAEKDRQLKFADYSAIPELREIVFIDSRSKFVEIYRRDSIDAEWTFNLKNTGVFSLPSVGIELDVDRLYRDWSPEMVARAL